MVERGGVEPTEPRGSRFTVCRIYRFTISPYITAIGFEPTLIRSHVQHSLTYATTVINRWQNFRGKPTLLYIVIHKSFLLNVLRCDLLLGDKGSV